MKRRKASSKREPTISLINIVFLILIFFMVAGSLSGRGTDGVSFVQTHDLDCCIPPEALIITQDGRYLSDGAVFASPNDYLAQSPTDDRVIRLMPDQALPAKDLLETIKALKAGGAEKVIIVTEHIPE